jgi:hypothetical protein
MWYIYTIFLSFFLYYLSAGATSKKELGVNNRPQSNKQSFIQHRKGRKKNRRMIFMVNHLRLRLSFSFSRIKSSNCRVLIELIEGNFLLTPILGQSF